MQQVLDGDAFLFHGVAVADGHRVFEGRIVFSEGFEVHRDAEGGEANTSAMKRDKVWKAFSSLFWILHTPPVVIQKLSLIHISEPTRP